MPIHGLPGSPTRPLNHNDARLSLVSHLNAGSLFDSTFYFLPQDFDQELRHVTKHGLSHRRTVESVRRLSIGVLRRDKLLMPGTAATLSWWKRGTEWACMQMFVHRDGLRLVHLQRDSVIGTYQDVEEIIPLAVTEQPLGGFRTWLLCPGCGRRVTDLYAGNLFRCRHCYHLTYASQCQSNIDRRLSQVQKARKRLGGCADMTKPFPDKPRCMHWSTYRFIRAHAEQREAELWRAQWLRLFPEEEN